MVFVWAADFLVERGIKAAGMAEFDLISERKNKALKQLEKAAEDLEARREKIIMGMEFLLRGGGIVWRRVQTGTTTAELYEVHFADAKTGWVIGDEGTILHTTDGKTWTKQNSGTTTAILLGVHFADAKTGWVIGDEGTILHTTDGKTWTEQDSGTTADLYEVHFADAKTGWVIGDEGTILHTTDGKTWTAQDSSTTTAILLGVHFADAKTGWVIGDEGTILHTTDGKTWTEQDSGTTADLYEVHFADAKTGWVIGDEGTILHTTDGKTWTAQDSSTTTAILYSVHFTDAKTGWVIGDEGTVLMTRDYEATLAGLTIGEQIERARNTPFNDLFEKKGYLDVLEATGDSLRANQANQDSIKADIDAFTKLGAAATAPSPPPKGKLPDTTDGTFPGTRVALGAFFTQTSVIRVTTILLIAFLVQILVSLYRYNTRLAGYYDARADAVLMTRFAGAEFDKLVDLLSPDRFDFGRQPRSPASNAVELAREILRPGRPRS